jgi:hypothetical protein
MNLSMQKTTEHALDLPLSKVYSFLDIFQKLSNFQASAAHIGTSYDAKRPPLFSS